MLPFAGRRPDTARRRGQGMTEYIIIVVVVALLTLVIVTKFGDQIRNLFITSGERLAGDSSSSVENKMSGEEADRTIQDL